MKKIYLFLLALCAVALVSCGSPASKIIDVYEDATSAVKKATSKGEIRDITSEAQTAAMVIGMEAMTKDASYEPTEAEQEKMEAAYNAFDKACKERRKEL